MVVVALLSVDLVESVDLVSVELVVNCSSNLAGWSMLNAKVIESSNKYFLQKITLNMSIYSILDTSQAKLLISR